MDLYTENPAKGFATAGVKQERQQEYMLPKGMLVVEDQDEIRALLVMIFQSEGYRVFEARDGQEALDLFVSNRPEIGIVLTDLGLPKLGGMDLISRMRALSPDVKIIGSSGFGRENVRQQVLRAGGDEFIPKPFVTTVLVETARRLMKRQS